MVAGKKQRHLHNAEYEAARAAKLLTSAANQAVDITGVVVIVQHEFAALRTLVDRARRRRAGWILALFILALLILAPVVLANLTRLF